ncbi:MAG TPA: hypothetical protein VLB11_04680 [Methyloceanibacter sp.]|nr:hypothetical protein [Methyloceanibacter sp.]
MTRTMLRDALSALAAVTLASAAPGAAASAQGQSVRAYRAEVAIDAVRGPKPKAAKRLGAQTQAAPLGVAQDVMSLTGPAPASTPNGQNWRWWQDYGGGSLTAGSTQNGAAFRGRR